ncbi:hypothetical protein JAAARDRAFT_307273 [Jaapia argillacea MUCL 33604]|uniref:Protein kinase domain-containing protein n=1 Tax=Jaapia argillacea MUCL 33604 TaxID=933084 RepID=A0A067Q103_9AGAM|nr:hypothetical protein JAAARDRAFT_307273 [Jaapia argillacea MUCL 33604]
MKPLKEPGGREVLTLADEEIISRYNANSQMDHIPTDTIRAIIILWLKIILGSLDAQECILELRDDEARVFLTAFQEFLDWMRDETKALSLLPEASLQDIRDLRRRAMRLLVNLTKSSKDFPPSLFFTVQGKLPRDISIPGNNANLYIVSHKVGDQVTTLVAKQLRTFLNCQADAAKVREEFYREAITWRQVDHPRLLPFLGIWQYPSYPEDIPFLVAPYMEKGSSKGYVANKDVTREIVNRLLVDTLEGLVYLHSLGIVHCDIAGKNVLVDDSSGEIRALLCDFGISGVYSNPHSTMYNPPSELAGGTLRWMAPETQDAKLHARQQPSFKSDSYSFGSLALELYSGMIPFEVEFPSVRDEARISLEVVKGLRPAHPGAGMYGREMPPWLWSLIGECWKDDPAERPDATTLLERLRKETLLK